MDALRWILLLIGAAIVVAIWWSGHRRSRERDESLFERARRVPGDESPSTGLEADSAPDFDINALEDAAAARDAGPPAAIEPGTEDDTAPATEPEAAAPEPAPAEPAARPQGRETAGEGPADREGTEERLEVVYVVAPRGERFIGSQLHELFAHQGLEYGELGIFHKRDAEGHTLFSVANLVEPGTFDPATMDTLSTPGLALFVRLPGPPSAETAFDRMIASARGLADALEARILDGQHSTLTRQTEQHLRDRLREFDLLQQRGGR